MIKVLIAEEKPMVCEGIKHLIEKDSMITVIGFAGDSYETVRLCHTLNPDIVLMNITSSDCNSIKCINLIKEETDTIKFLVLADPKNNKIISQALLIGADSYIPNDSKPEELIFAIRSSFNGLVTIHRDFFKVILSQYSSQNANGYNVALNEKEKKIIEYLALGRSNKEIARDMHLSAGRVRNIISDILSKLYLKNRTQLALFAVKNHLF